MSRAVNEAPFITAESGMSSQGKPQCGKVISFQHSMEGDSSMPLPPGTVIFRATGGADNIHTYFGSL